MKKLILPIVVVLLLLLGVRGILLDTIGERTSGVITGIEVEDSAEHEYKINYSFTIDGESYSSSYQKEILNITKAPKKGEVVRIRYLDFAPYMNGIEGKNMKGGIILLIISVVVILFGGRIKRSD